MSIWSRFDRHGGARAACTSQSTRSKVPDLDTAIHWAAKIPSAAHGSIEIRPQTANQALSQV
jgi:hypothetical protein